MRIKSKHDIKKIIYKSSMSWKQKDSQMNINIYIYIYIDIYNS